VILRGVAGRIEWCSTLAAAVDAYTVTRTREDPVFRLTATLAAVDAFRLAQRPLRFVVGAVSWPVERFDIINGSFTATLGDPDEDS